MLGGVILLETLVKIGLAFGMGKLVRRIVCLVNGRIGFALSLMQQFEEVSKLVEIIRHPQDHVARGPVAGDEAQAPIRGHAKADELVILKCFKMRSPGLSRTVRGQLDVEDRRASRVNGDQNGRMDGKNLIAEIKHQCL